MIGLRSQMQIGMHNLFDFHVFVARVSQTLLLDGQNRLYAGQSLHQNYRTLQSDWSLELRRGHLNMALHPHRHTLLLAQQRKVLEG